MTIILFFSCFSYLQGRDFDFNRKSLIFQTSEIHGKKTRFNVRACLLDKPSRPQAGSMRVELEGTLLAINSAESPITGRILLSLPDLPWALQDQLIKGSCLSTQAQLNLLNNPDISPFSYDAYLKRRGVIGWGSAREIKILSRRSENLNDNIFQKITSSLIDKRKRFIEKLFVSFGSRDSLAVILASTISENDVLNDNLLDLFRETGTSHLLVVSGFHVGVVFALLRKLLWFLWSRIELLILLYPAQIIASIGGLIGTVFYSFITGLTLTNTRALLLLAVYTLGEVLNRRSAYFRSLLLIILMLLLIWPGAQFELGPQLTISALLGLLVASTILKNYTLGPHWVNCIVKAFLISGGAWIFTSPVLLLWFENIVPLGPIINLIAIPVFSTICIAFGGSVLVYCYFSLPMHNLLLEFNLCLIDIMLFSLEFVRDGLETGALGFQILSETNANILAGVFGFIVIILTIVCLTQFVPDTNKLSSSASSR